MRTIRVTNTRVGSILAILLTMGASGALQADSEIQEAMDTAEVYVYGREAKNEALLKEISDPDAYDTMAEKRGNSTSPVNENIKMQDVEITRVEGDRAVARATYGNRHGKQRQSTEVHLQRVDGKWQVTTPPPATD